MARIPIAIVLGELAMNSKVILDGIDISHYICGIEVRAMVNERTAITLHLIAGVELTGEAGQLLIEKS